MPVVEGVRAGPQPAAHREGMRVEPVAHRSVQGGAVALERDQIVAAPRPDRRGHPWVAKARVQAGKGCRAGRGPPAGRAARPTRRPPPALPPWAPSVLEPATRRCARTRPLSMAKALTRCSGVFSPRRSKERRSVLPSHRDLQRRVPCNLRVARPEGGPRPGQERVLELRRVDQHQHPADGVVRRDTARQRQVPRQPGPLGLPVERDVLKALRPRQHRADRNRQDVRQPVLDLARLPRIVHRAQAVQQISQHDATSPNQRSRES